MNLGKWISDRYNNDESTQKRFAKAHHESEITMIYHALEMSKLSRLWIDWDRWQVMLDFFALPEVTSRVAARGSALPILTTCPVSSRKNVYMHPYMFSMDESAKFGADGKFPSNVQIRAHFGSVVTRGFESERESLEIKFPKSLREGQELPIFTTCFLDGHCKSVMIQAIFGIMDSLDSWFQLSRVYS